MKEPIFSTMDQGYQGEFGKGCFPRYRFYDKRFRTRKKNLFFRDKLTKNLRKMGASEPFCLFTGKIGSNLLEIAFIGIF